MEFTGSIKHIDTEMARDTVAGDMVYTPMLKVTVLLPLDRDLVDELGRWREWGNVIAFSLTNTEPDVPEA